MDLLGCQDFLFFFFFLSLPPLCFVPSCLPVSSEHKVYPIQTKTDSCIYTSKKANKTDVLPIWSQGCSGKNPVSVSSISGSLCALQGSHWWAGRHWNTSASLPGLTSGSKAHMAVSICHTWALLNAQDRQDLIRYLLVWQYQPASQEDCPSLSKSSHCTLSIATMLITFIAYANCCHEQVYHTYSPLNYQLWGKSHLHLLKVLQHPSLQDCAHSCCT